MSQNPKKQSNGSRQMSLSQFLKPMAEQSDGGDKVLASVENRAVKRHPSPDLISKEPQTKKRRLESDVEEESKPNQQHTPSTTTVIRSPMSTTRTGAGVMQTPTSRRSHKANDEEEGRFDFISEDKIRDAKGRRPDHPEYDSSTLFVPPDFMRKQSPGHRQWWTFKANNYDAILLFKVGKFYEFYHFDAKIGIEVLGLTSMTGGNFLHCGFPEASREVYEKRLVSRGYKVARIEQTETPSELTDRNKNSATKDKVVKRELCQIQSVSTAISFVGAGIDQEIREKDFAFPKYLMALVEKRETALTSNFGVSFVDCSTGKIQLSQFLDDESQSALRTLLAHNFPAEVLYQRKSLSAKTLPILRNMLANVPQRSLPSQGFMSPDDVIMMLMDCNHLGAVDTWPEEIRSILLDSDSILPKINPSYDLAVSAFGGILAYLKRCLIDVDITSMKLFSRYTPPSLSSGPLDSTSQSRINWTKQLMVLDGTSLWNLHILPPSAFSTASRAADSSSQGFERSLFSTIDNCSTAFGRRLLREWVCTPTCDPTTLKERQCCIKYLAGEGLSFMQKASVILAKVPDIAKLLQRVHSNSLKYRSTEHPDSRANFFSGNGNKRRIKCFLGVLDGLDFAEKIINLYQEGTHARDELLDSLMGSLLSDFSTNLDHFKNAFDRKIAENDAVIAPKRGTVPQYDSALGQIEACQEALGDFLQEQKRKLKCKDVKFAQGKAAYQLDIPDSIKVGKDYESQSSTKKGWRRYTTVKLNSLIQNLKNAEEERDNNTQEAARIVFEEFDNQRDIWAAIVRCLANLDVLFSLAKYAIDISAVGIACFPSFDFASTKPYLDVTDGVHPCFTASEGTKGFVPSSCRLGGEMDENGQSVMLLTGPNMGGKSTFMRATSLLVVLAQIGSMVPARAMRLTPCDRIFCRVGASDRLSAGQSTFYVELAETNIIIKHATAHSLVIIDELGRGTGTHDGVSIAASVLKYISGRIRCRTIFSTHYHTICTMIKGDSNVKLAHMAYEEDHCEEVHAALKRVTFLYRVRNGPCLKSYGYHTAAMAGIPENVILRAHEASRKYLVKQAGN